MAIYLKPRRGSKQAAFTQNIGLKKGEIFLEFPTGYVGGEPGRIVIGDGATSYERIDYAATSTNVFQPFITDPSIYVPRFKDPIPTKDYNNTTTVINEMGDGTADGEKLPNIIGSIKKSLYKITDGLATLNTNVNNELNELNANKLSINGDTCTNIVFSSENSSTSTMKAEATGIYIENKYQDTELDIDGYGLDFYKRNFYNKKYITIDKYGMKCYYNSDEYIYIKDADIFSSQGWGRNSEGTGLRYIMDELLSGNRVSYSDNGWSNMQTTTDSSSDLLTTRIRPTNTGSGKVMVFVSGIIKISENQYDNYACLTIKYKKTSDSNWTTDSMEWRNYESYFQSISGVNILNLEKGEFYDIKLCLEARGTGISSIKTATLDHACSWAILEI